MTYKAKDIQTGLNESPTCVEVGESAFSAMNKLDNFSYDQAPVTENGVIVGWILRSDILETSEISQIYKVLQQSDLISSEAPLNDLLERLLSQKLIFLVGSSGIEGFAVQSDIERHVSRAHIYLLISGLEISISRILSRNISDLTKVIPFMSSKSKEFWVIAKTKDQDANPVEYLDLRALGGALTVEKNALIHLGMSEARWKVHIDMLVNIRNWVAHSNTQEMRREPFEIVVNILKQTENHIKKLVDY